MAYIRYDIGVSGFYVENFGCRATQADGAAIEQQFRAQGMERASLATDAELVVLNTCTVTASADQDARAAIRRIHRENPACKIVVTGCYAQRAPDEIAALPGVAQVIGNSHKHKLAELALSQQSFVPLQQLRTSIRELETETFPHLPAEIYVSDIFAHTELLAAPVFDAANERTRPNLKVQDGCDNRCSFCVIPSVRGQSRSLPLSRILAEVDTLVGAGYREVVISGINLGRWGRDLPSGADAQSFFISGGTTEAGPSRREIEGLVRAILDHTSLEKLRISSVEPMDWSDELIALMASSSRIAKHAHVPMQSGSDAVLRRMHRKYRPWHYREKIEKIRAAMPDAAIGADVMTGFPGETETEFEETRRMVEDLPFTYLHVFTYSARPGTPAVVMPGQVPVEKAREHNRILRDLAAKKKLSFMRSFVGKTVSAITLNEFDNDRTEALTDNYLKLRLDGRHSANCWLNAYIERVEDGVLIGSLSHQTDLHARIGFAPTCSHEIGDLAVLFPR